MKDKAGREIGVGDYIVYGHTLGRCAGLQYGIVLATGETKNWSGKARENIKVRGVDADWSSYAPRLLKTGTLFFGDRILLVEDKQIPKKVLDLLKGVAL